MKELLRQKTYQGALSKINSPLDPSFKLRQLKYVKLLKGCYKQLAVASNFSLFN